MAKKRYEADYVLNLNKTISSLQNAKKQAEAFDDIMASIGDRGNLNDLIKYFLGLDDVVDELRQSTDALISGLGDSLKGGYIKSLDGVFGKLADISNKTKTLLTSAGTLDLTDPNAAKNLEQMAIQLNEVFKAFNINNRIDLKNFLSKPLEDQKKRIVAALQTLNSDINTTLGSINVGNIEKDIGDALGGAGVKIEDFSKEIQQTIKKLEDQNEQLSSLQKELKKTAKMIDDVKSKGNSAIPDDFILDTKDVKVNKIINLLDAYDDLDTQLKSGKLSTEEYADSLIRLTEITMTLKDALSKIKADESLRNLFSSLSGGRRGGNLLGALSEYASTKSTGLFNKVAKANNDDIVGGLINANTSQIDRIKADAMKNLDEGHVDDGNDDLQKKIKLYNDLKEKVKEYKKAVAVEMSDDATEEEVDEAYQRMDDLTNEIIELVGATEKLRDVKSILQTLSVGEDETKVLEGLCVQLGVEIPQAATEVGGAFKQITQDINEAGNAAQKVMYHIGNLLNGKGQARDTFGDMAYNLTESAVGSKYEKYGFGVLGGGLFGVTDPSTIDKEPGKSSFIQSIDLSKYNMYMADTEERATALIDFLSKLQKFSMKSAAPNYTGFDAYLQGVDINALYEQAKVLFDQSELTKEQFNSFVNEMVSLLKEAGLEFDATENLLDFTNISDKLAGSENISTRFMKMLGYEGVHVGTTSFDGLGQGSVLFDFERVDIVGYFDSVKSAVQDFEKILDGTWVGSREQLQQYASNIDVIVDKILTYKNSGVLKDTSELDETLNKLTAIRTNIDNILSGKDISGNSPFETITTGVDRAGSATEDASAAIKEQNELLQQRNALLEEEAKKKQEALDATITEKQATEEELSQERIISNELAQRAMDAELLADKEKERADLLEQQNIELKEQLELRNEISVQEDSEELSDEEEEIRKENGALEDRLEILRDIADMYGVQISQKDRNRYEELADKDNEDGLTTKEAERFDELSDRIYEADSNLLDFEETYDRIILKLSNGKKLEILPNDKGLRDLYKISDEYGTYNGHEIEAVQFVRQEQFLKTKIDSYEELCKVVQRFNELRYKDRTNKEEIEMKALLERIQATKGQVSPDQALSDSVAWARIFKDLGGVQPDALASYLGIEIPKAAAQAEQATEDVTNEVYEQIKSYEKLNQIIEEHNDIVKRIRNKAIVNIYERAAKYDDAPGRIVDVLGLDFDKDYDVISQLLDRSSDLYNQDGTLSIDKLIDAIVVKLPKAAKVAEAALDEIKKETEYFDTQTGQLALFEGMSGELHEAEAKAEELKDTIKEIAVLDGQIGFDDFDKQEQQLPLGMPNQLNAIDISAEEQQLNSLVLTLDSVIKMINAKTDAFRNEADAVDIAVAQEIAALSKLEQYLMTIKTLMQSLFDPAQMANVTFESWKNDLSIIEANVKNILDYFVGIENTVSGTGSGLDGLKSQDINVDAGKTQPVGGDYALETTLQGTNSILESIFKAITTTDDNSQIASALEAATQELRDVANGIVQQQKSQKVDTRAASARIADSATYSQISDIARNVVSGLGSEIKLDSLTALKDGVVKVEGAFKNADGVWEGFTVKVNQANEAVDLGTKKQSAFAKALNEANDATKTTQANASIQTQKDRFAVISNKAANYSHSGVITSELENYRLAIEKLEQAQYELVHAENLSEEEIKQKRDAFAVARQACNDYAAKIDKLIRSSDHFGNKHTNVTDDIGDFDLNSINGQEAALRNYVDTMYAGKATIVSFDTANKELYFTLKNNDGTVSQMAASFDASMTQIGSSVDKTKKATTGLRSLLDTLGQKSKGLLTYATARLGVDELFQQIRKGIQYVREIDSALTELKKVTDETDATYNKFLQNMSKTAGVVGSTVAELTTMAAEWARLGYSIEDSAKLAESTAILLNVSEFSDATAASEALISTMQAFQYTADESQHVVDILNEVGK